jgi:hypothetical protein
MVVANFRDWFASFHNLAEAAALTNEHEPRLDGIQPRLVCLALAAANCQDAFGKILTCTPAAEENLVTPRQWGSKVGWSLTRPLLRLADNAFRSDESKVVWKICLKCRRPYKKEALLRALYLSAVAEGRRVHGVVVSAEMRWKRGRELSNSLPHSVHTNLWY